MQKAYQKLVEKVEKIERDFSSLQDFVISTNFQDGHMMRMGEISSSFLHMNEVYQELDDLTFADLEDFQRLMVYGVKF